MTAHTDSKGFIKTTSNTSQCVLGIKCNHFILSSPWKIDNILNKTPESIIKKSPDRPRPSPIRIKHRDLQLNIISSIFLKSFNFQSS